MIVGGVSVFILAAMFIFGIVALVGGAKEAFRRTGDDEKDYPQALLMLVTGLLFVAGAAHHVIVQVWP